MDPGRGCDNGPERSTTVANEAAKLPNVSAPSLAQMKTAGQRIVMCTAYDYPSAHLADLAGVDSILVGDSVGMTVLGYSSTLPVTVDEMVAATAAVTRATTRPLIVADLPFMSYQISFEEGMRAAARLVKEGGAEAVKIEGATPLTLELISGLVGAGIPVIGHLGLTPQSVNAFGGYRVQGRQAIDAAVLIMDAENLAAAGVSAIVLECIPSELAAHVTSDCGVPTIGIGAGLECDGEVQVFHDLIGLGSFLPKHAKRYLDGADLVVKALANYAADVREGAFPEPANATPLGEGVLDEALSLIGDTEIWEG